jgi:alanine racemase
MNGWISGNRCAENAAEHIRNLGHLNNEGLFSHYATADVEIWNLQQTQHRQFLEGLNLLKLSDLRFRW